jgi:tetratricopeptide (TPR) repeat protein
LQRQEYRAFLSYSHRDAKWADWLHKSIESYRPPRHLVGVSTERGTVPKRLTPVFRDREELASATDLGEVIRDALSRSASQIVICSPQSAKSHWVNEEILAYKRLGREDRIFCLIIGGEPNASDLPGREAEECFPPALRFRLAADGTLSNVRTEPIAADARPGKDGRRNAKLKLIAGILGVGFDLLRRREQQRRNRRLFAYSVAATTGMVFTTGLAAYALVQRARAEKQTARAEAEAETAKQTTGFLVDLFRISDPGEARGNTVTAREMLDKGAVRIDKELAQQPVIQATLMDTVGTVYMGLGLYDRARPLLDRASSIRRRAEDPDGVALPGTLNHLGEVLTLQADYAAAERTYRQAIALQSAHPKSRDANIAAARSLRGLGTVLARQGRYPDAEKLLREALQRQREVYGNVHGDIARTLQDLSQVVDQQGDTKTAIALLQDAVAIQRSIHAGEPHPDLAAAINDLGLLHSEAANYAESEALFRESLAMKHRLLGDKHPEIAAGLTNLASVLSDKGDLAGAATDYRQALAMQVEMLGEWHPDVADTLNNLAFVLYDQGKRSEALATERRALAVYRKLFSGDHPEVARIMNRIGYWLTESSDYAEADVMLEDALGMRQRLLGASHPDVASSLTHLAILDVKRGRYPQALESARGALAILVPAFSADHWRAAVAESAEGAALSGLGQLQFADKKLTHSDEVLAKDRGAPATYRTLNRQFLAQLRERQQHLALLKVPASP